jgi:hypothetical protein
MEVRPNEVGKAGLANSCILVYAIGIQDIYLAVPPSKVLPSERSVEKRETIRKIDMEYKCFYKNREESPEAH